MGHNQQAHRVTFAEPTYLMVNFFGNWRDINSWDLRFTLGACRAASGWYGGPALPAWVAWQWLHRPEHEDLPFARIRGSPRALDDGLQRGLRALPKPRRSPMSGYVPARRRGKLDPLANILYPNDIKIWDRTRTRK